MTILDGLKKEPVIRVQRLSHYYGSGDNKKQILFDIDLDIRPGELVIMTGPSGSGKSTLLSLIGALRTVQEGSLRVMGHELNQMTPSQLVQYRRDIGFIFQMHNLFESLTAMENVKMSLQLKKVPRTEKRDQAGHILNRLGLEERIHYKPESLSGGQRQRVAVARALATRPRVILADEPTAALDKESGKTVVEMLRELCETNDSTVLLITHDNRILDFADRIVNMVDGRIVSNVLVAESVAICEFLIKSNLFANLAASTLTDIAQKMELEIVSAGKWVIRQGDPGDKFYLIRKGITDVVVRSGAETKKVATLGEGNFFGEAALLTGEPRNASVLAKEETVLYSLDKENFQMAIDSSKTFKEQLLNAFYQRQ
ncbi:MAG: ABC transporter ATP-binding protein [Nitrospinae bacterium CG11_big_fil_rev_8_21_14_0_20_56_8]|nr:MAG: ABC transporter ATP-binding protein [Nitrospinae bacterium CG11_big_fil_rev_8_21_14_0_20_56_8]